MVCCIFKQFQCCGHVEKSKVFAYLYPAATQDLKMRINHLLQYDQPTLSL